MTSDAQLNTPDGADRVLHGVRRGYVAALAILAVLTLATQLLTQYSLGEQLQDSEIINIAGRQRMLSQRIARDAFAPSRAHVPADLEAFEASHERLLRGDLSGFATYLGDASSARLDARFDALLSSTRAALAGEANADEQLLAASDAFLQTMDDAVFRYASGAELALESARDIELALALALLFVLLLEALFIFRPLLRRLGRAVGDLRNLARRLSESEAMHARALAGAQDGIFDWKRSTGTLLLSPRFRELAGIDDHATGWNAFSERLEPVDQTRLQEALQSGAIDLELRLRVGSELRWLRLLGKKSGDDYVAGTLADIDARRRLELERERLLEARERDLRETREDLVRAEIMSSVGTLAGGLAHDFNNYIQVIKLAVAAMRDGKPDAESLAAIDEAADEASMITRQLLALRSGYGGEVFDAVDLSKLMEETTKLIRRTMPSNVHVSVESPQDLPAVWADGAQLKQVFVNLCLNARDAMAKGGPIRLRACPAERTTVDGLRSGVEICVEDEGSGMTPECQQRIFEPFFTTKAQGKGTGLGMAIVDSILRRHAGTLDVESAVGAGTTVRVWLPAADRDVRPKRSYHHTNAGPLRVLFVDDEPGIVRAATRLLKSAGHAVDTATCTEDAGERLDRREYDLIICDVMLPDGLGTDMIAARTRLPPVLFISGYSDEAVKTGESSAFLRKPFTAIELADAMDELLSRASSRDSAPYV